MVRYFLGGSVILGTIGYGTMAVFVMGTLTVSPLFFSSEESTSEPEADFIWTDLTELDRVSSVSCPELEAGSVPEGYGSGFP